MKLAKLSLAAIVVAGLASSSFAADTLADAFKNGTVNGELKAYYFTNDNGKSSEDIFSTGVLLGYKTASLYGLSLGLTFQGSASPFADDGGKDRFNSSMYGPGAVLSEAYVAYNIGKTTAMVGRMFLDTPLVASSGSRIVKEAFEGAAVINTDLPNTTLIAGYVQKFQSRTNRDGKIGEFTKSFATNSWNNVDVEDGAYTLAAINKSVTGLTLTAAYADVNNIIQVAYAEALYEGKAGEIGYTLGGQYYYNKLDSSLVAPDDTIGLYAVKAGLSFKGINGTVAYSKVGNDDVATGVVISGLGNGADLLYTDAVIAMNGYNRDTASYLVDLNYDLTAAANIGARYVVADGYLDAGLVGATKTTTADKYKASSTAVYGTYKFESLKGFSLGAQYEHQDKDVDGDDLWVKANYKF
ncbi:outer membrane porin, OprD family [Sulfurospirillum diekertiae]|uniref:Outer membrane porin n=1 Tax=Sulfurospirillum diekertiae TaxID=1854492 RepID=A0A290HSA0_9BACT|nr:OprD family outer membrane porin [Sulfurospirillum diekertiae]ATB68696.1 outer membrane porin [Sulfurospirillum diekertiae]QIR76527.1 outer membrane porin, OprD family [Sulfurospirillum diekertiae]QIR79156.1 outer membrane porin, OprD family [Sulfurospirillum diekertiae]